MYVLYDIVCMYGWMDGWFVWYVWYVCYVMYVIMLCMYVCIYAMQVCNVMYFTVM